MFSVVEKLALIYTFAGSMRRMAQLLGVTHQRVSRALHGEAGRVAIANLAPYVDAFWPFYVDHAAQVARDHGLPFDRRIPVYYERLMRSDNVLGDRVAALHTHWLSDKLREQWIESTRATQKFYAVSVESMVNLLIYFKRGEEMYKGGRSEKMRTARGNIALKLHKGILYGPMYTSYTQMRGKHSTRDLVLNDIRWKLRTKHEPATGDPGTYLASSILLQVDTMNDADIKFRAAHPYPRKKRTRRSTSKRKAPPRKR